MVEFNFSKMHGAGNDFLMIDDRTGLCRLSKDSIAGLCARHRGIGADGLILLRPSAAAHFAMRYYNSDGGEADMCGNGARCAAAFAFECGIAGRSMTFETRAGILSAEILDEGVRIGVTDVRDLALGMKIAASAGAVHYGLCGVPHAVIVDDEARKAPHDEFVRFARGVRSDPAFGAPGANVNVVSLTGKNSCAYRTYERGVEDETFACGTGAVVTAVVLAHLEFAEAPILCETFGGDGLEVDFTRTAGGASGCRLKGPVATAFRGTFRLEDYEHP